MCGSGEGGRHRVVFYISLCSFYFGNHHPKVERELIAMLIVFLLLHVCLYLCSSVFSSGCNRFVCDLWHILVIFTCFWPFQPKIYFQMK